MAAALAPIVTSLANTIVMNSALGIVASHAIASFVVRTLTSFVISSVVNAFSKPKEPSLSLGTQQQTVTIRQPTAARQVIYGTTRVGGTMLFADIRDGYLHLVVEWAGHECDAIEALYFGEDEVPLDGGGAATGDYAGFAWCNHHLGTADQLADSDLVAACPDKWTTAHRARGRCYSYIKIKKSQEKYPTGLPNVSVRLRGKKVYDPRTSTTVWTDNAALCVADWLTDSTFGLGADYATEINETELIAAANVCDEAVTLADTSTEDRYTCNGVIKADQQHKGVLAALSSAMAGAVAWRHGTWHTMAGAYITPTVTLDENDIRAPFNVKSGVSRDQLFNAVKGTYISPDNFYQPADFPAVTNSTYETEDNSERLWKDLELPFTDSPATAQRIAKIVLERGRQGITGTLPCRLSALKAIAGGTINLTYDRFGWSSKPFEVERWAFVVYDQDGAPTLGVDLELRETASTVFDWANGEETTVDPAPDTNLPLPSDIGAPSNLTLDSGTSYLLQTSEGSIISRLHASWDAPSDAFTLDYEVEYQRQGDSAWTPAGRTNGNEFATIAPAEDGTNYLVRVRAVTRWGNRGAWTTSAAHQVVGKSAAPTTPATFTIDRLADGTRRFAWDLVSDADVRAGGGYRLRYYSGATSDWSAMTALHDGVLTATPWETNELSAGTYTFAIKAVDSSGNESSSATFISATIGDPRLQNVLLQRQEHDLAWPGTLTSCWKYGNTLIADASSDIGDLPTAISSLSSTIREMVTHVSPLVYETPEIDLGADVNFTPLVSVVANGSLTAYMKTGTTADGGVTGSYVALDNVTAKRYVQIKVEIAGTHPELSQMSLLIDSETKVDEFNDVATATESATWFNRIAAGHFEVGSSSGELGVISSASIRAIQSVGAGWTWELISKSKTVNGQPAAEFKVYNSTPALADATVDIELKGPKG